MYFVIGASVRALSQAIRRSGRECCGADLFADFDTVAACRAAVRLENLTDGCDQIGKFGEQGCVIAGGMENHCQTLQNISRIVPLIGCPVDVIRRVRDPLDVVSALMSHGIPALEVRTTCPQNSEDWIVKPVRSVGGQYVRRLANVEVEAISGRVYFQKFAGGEPISATFIAYPEGSLLVGATRQLVIQTSDSDFCYVGSIGPIPLDSSQRGELLRMGDVLVREFGLIGWFGVDCVMNETGFWPLEINPRYTASMELFELTFANRMFQWHLGALQARTDCEERPQAFRLDALRFRMEEFQARSSSAKDARFHEPNQMIGKRYVFNRSQASIVIDEPGFEFLVSRQQPMGLSFPQLTDIPRPNQMIAKNHPICTVWARGNSVNDISMQLSQSARRVESALIEKQYRNASAPRLLDG